MNWPRLLLSALVIAVLNLASVVIGFMVHGLSGAGDQLAVQLPVAFLTGVGLVVVCVAFFDRYSGLREGADYMAVFLLVFPVGTAVFAVTHFIVTGYVTSIGNIVYGIPVYFVENAIALPLGAALARRRRGWQDGATLEVG